MNQQFCNTQRRIGVLEPIETKQQENESASISLADGRDLPSYALRNTHSKKTSRMIF